MSAARCAEWATHRSDVSGRFDQSYVCGRPVKWRISSALPNRVPMLAQPEVCGIHALPARKDNIESVRKPWIIERLGSE